MREVVEGPGDDTADAGSRTIEREQELSLMEASRDLLDEFDLALKRLADGGYGLCQTCGEAIGKMRLQYLPRATACLACKQREERRH